MLGLLMTMLSVQRFNCTGICLPDTLLSLGNDRILPMPQHFFASAAFDTAGYGSGGSLE
jgi:hypothetical protein